jgi:hypothetical protein
MTFVVKAGAPHHEGYFDAALGRPTKGLPSPTFEGSGAIA